MATDRPSPVERARKLQPLVREYADQAERERRLPAPVAEALAREGLYRMAVLRSIGGKEADPQVQIETIAEADGSAGWNLMIEHRVVRPGRAGASPAAASCSPIRPWC